MGWAGLRWLSSRSLDFPAQCACVCHTLLCCGPSKAEACCLGQWRDMLLCPLCPLCLHAASQCAAPSLRALLPSIASRSQHGRLPTSPSRPSLTSDGGTAAVV